jgi:hypothetical protein
VGRVSASLLALALAAAAAVGLTACGGGEDAALLPGNTANEITANLNDVKQLAQSGECIGAEDEARQVSDQIDALGGVDKQLKQALRQGATRLNEVVAECEEETGEATAPNEALEESTTTEEPKKSKKPKPKKPATPPTETTTTTTPPALPPQSNGEGKGLGNGNGEGPPAAPPSEEGGDPSSGGVGPGEPAGGG